jgi:tetratricopeptide (TPR) repeat protein
VYNSVKQYEKAIIAFDFAIAINENYGSAYYNKANILSELERYSEAIECYMEFLKLEENHIMTHCYIGECYEKLHRYEEALYYFQTALAYDPDCADALFGTGIVKMHQELYNESIQNIERALSININCTEYLFALGLIYMRQNDSELSLKFFKQVTELDPTDFDAWLNYSEILFNSGKFNKAVDVLQKGLDFNFNNAYLNLRMASYLFLSRKIVNGIKFLEKALSLDVNCISELYEFYPDSIKNYSIMKVINKFIDNNIA